MKNHWKNILIYEMSYKTLIGAKPWRIRFNKVNGFVRVCDGTKYLILFGLEIYSTIYNKVIYLLELKSLLHLFFLQFLKRQN